MRISWRAGIATAPFLLFASLSLTAAAVGCVVAAAHGATAGEWVRDLIAWMVGGVLAGALALRAGPRTMALLLAAAPLALALTLIGGGLSGVHRWVQLGPLRINMAELSLPPALVACAILAPGRRAPWLAAVAALILLVLQPDASQATSFGVALVVIAWRSGSGPGWRFGWIGLIGAAAAASWLRHDPLEPAPEVEGVMGLAAALSPVLAVLAWAALAGAVLAPLAVARSASESSRTAALALAAYGVVSALTPLVRAFPVPLV
ncbi:MAG: hypothetical protein JSS35_06855, partial [Proteobacteria bacterium]|nr:hypothetical protein [Pseudomonadota bacterium]